MFSNQELDYSLHLPTRCLSAVAPPSAPPPPTRSSPRVDDDQSTSPHDDGDDIVAGASSAGDGWDDDDDAIDAIDANNDDDDDDYNLASSTWTTTHRFLVGTALPSASQFDLDSDRDDGDGDDDQPHNDDKALEDYLLTPLEALAEDDDNDNGHNNHNHVNSHHGTRENRLHLLQYREVAHELTCERSWRHPPGEVFAVACHPRKEEWVVTCGGGSVFTSLGGSGGGSGRKERVARFQTTLWRLPPTLYDGQDEMDDDDDDHVGDDDFQWGSNDSDNDNENQKRNNDKPRKRTASSHSDQLERLVVIPHGCQQHSSISSYGGWEQRVGCILWHPDLSPSSSSSDVDHSIPNDHSPGNDDVTTSSRGNLLTVGWDERSPVCLWDLSSSHARQLWSTSPRIARTPRRTRPNRLSPLQTSLPRRASWNPHHPHNILVASGTDVLSHDVRRPSREHETLAIRAAHRLGVADVSHDHSREHLVLTSGMDGVIKFWDWRMPLHSVSSSPSSSSPMAAEIHHGHDEPASPPLLLKAVRGGHSHWVTRATYNPFYDQLILSAGRDGIANLWRISSCSSAPLLDLDDNDDEDVDEDDYDTEDGGLEGDVEERHVNGMDDDKENQQREWMTMGNTTRSHDEDDDDENHEQEDNLHYDHPKLDDDSDERHNRNPAKTDRSSSKSTNTVSTAQDVRVTKYECSDAVADITWCSTDPWLYATLSCDGGVVVHHVPSKEKYKILL